MVKLTNKGKGKPSKRKNLKTKYKIQRKVKQHKKKLRKQMKKLGQKNIKPKSRQNDFVLPNSFPFKAQILKHYKDQKPAQIHAETHPQDPTQWGLIALQGRSIYFPKDKDHLTKKYITTQAKIWQYANTIIECVDGRNVQVCLSTQLSVQCAKRNVKHIVVVCKIDTIREQVLNKFKKALTGKTSVLFTTDPKKRNICVDEVLKAIKQSQQGQKKVIVVGKANTGKHTLIKQFMKLAKFHNQDYSSINQVKIQQSVCMIDTPYKIKDQTGYPLFNVPSTLAQQSKIAQQQKCIKYLVDSLKNRNDFIMHYGIQDFTSLEDLFKKIGKATRVFGKGGMVNVAAVRTTILTDWYQGKLNYIFE